MITTNERLLAAASEESLFLLGIKPTKNPSLSTFPERFDPEGFIVWKVLMADPEFVKKMNDQPTQFDKWTFVLKRYLKDCMTDGIVPFKHASRQAANEVAIAFLSKARMELTRFFRTNDLFANLKILKVERRYQIRDGNIVVSGTAIMRPGTWDPTLEKVIQQLPYPGFRRINSADRSYKRILQAHTELHIKFTGTSRLELGYSIFCYTVPRPELNGKVPTKTQAVKFIENNIWLPIVRQHRLPSVGLRLI